MKRLSASMVFGLLFLLLVSTSLAQQQAPAITAQQVKPNTYVLKGGMALNTGAFIGAEEVVLIDAKMTEVMAAQIIAEIRKLTPLPISHVFLTHSALRPKWRSRSIELTALSLSKSFPTWYFLYIVALDPALKGGDCGVLSVQTSLGVWFFSPLT